MFIYLSYDVSMEYVSHGISFLYQVIELGVIITPCLYASYISLCFYKLCR